MIKLSENVSLLTEDLMPDRIDGEILAKVFDLCEIVKRRQAKIEDDINVVQPSTDIEEGELQWHCYICGYSWFGHDKINPEPPDKCANQECKRLDYNKLSNLGRHDPTCEKCRRKLAKKMKDIDEIKKRFPDFF